MIRRGIGVQSFVSAGGGTDADAQAVITAIESTGVTLTATQKTACNTLVTDLKSYGIWTKLKAVYGFLGGTAGAHKWNWKDPRDLDAAYRLVFNGGGTHSSTGYLPNGTNGYGDTFLIPNSVFSSNNAHGSFYSRSNTPQAFRHSFGCYEGVGTTVAFDLTLNYSSTVKLGSTIGNTNFPILGVTNTNTTGYYVTSRIANNNFFLQKNGNTVGTNTNTVVNNSFPNTKKISIGALNAGNYGYASYDDRQCAFASFGDGLTTTEAANLYTAVQAYQTSLSRNV